MSVNKRGESLILQTTLGAITGVIMRPVTVSNVNVGFDPIVPAVPALIQENVPVAENVLVEEDAPEQVIGPYNAGSKSNCCCEPCYLSGY
jgi:hypothetical protein